MQHLKAAPYGPSATWWRFRRRRKPFHKRLHRADKTRVQRLKPNPAREAVDQKSARLYLLRRELEDLYLIAGLSCREKRYCNLLVAGWSLGEIGSFGGVSDSMASRVIRRAVGKVRLARRDYPYADLWEVYDSETR